MKITEKMIERFNANRPVHMQLLKKLLKRVPVVNLSTDKSEYLESVTLNAHNSTYGGRVYDITTSSKDRTGNVTNTNVNINIDDQLHNYDQAEVQQLREQIAGLTKRIKTLEEK